MMKWNSRQNLTAIAVALFVVSCSPTPPAAPPDYSAAPPAIAQGFYVENQETIEIDVPRAQLLAWLDQINLAEILTATEGMPSVK